MSERRIVPQECKSIGVSRCPKYLHYTTFTLLTPDLSSNPVCTRVEVLRVHTGFEDSVYSDTRYTGTGVSDLPTYG